jgi:flagellar protein FlbD
MIKLTRLGGEAFILNADLIQYVEARPDTFITLQTGERLIVTESMDEVLRRAVAYQQTKHMIPPPHSGGHEAGGPAGGSNEEPGSWT